jgi:molybdopterin/thiamine biosynthesis adenylyltransferase
VIGLPAAEVLVEYLVACGVRRWVVMAENGWIDEVAARLGERYGDLIELEFRRVEEVTEIAGVDLAIVLDDGPVACRLPVSAPRLAIFTPTARNGAYAVSAMAGESFELASPAHDGLVGGWEWLTAAPLMALLSRALLLRGTPYRMRTWEEAFANGMRVYCPGSPTDPTCARWSAQGSGAETDAPLYRTPLRRQGTLLIVGLGSLGSVAAEHLAPRVERLVLADPDRVELANLVRQNYAHYQMGAAKAVALARRLSVGHRGLVCEAVVASLTCEEEVSRLLERYQVSAALVTTGTHADFAIARALWAAGIPHVVGRCYGRARYWEGIMVDGGPSYEEVRRGVVTGPAPAPTPEEVAAYGAVDGLAAEPATAMECGWAASWLARLTAQMMNPPALREGWLLARLAAGANCLIGGVVVEEGMEGSEAGEFAYGVAVPGEVHAWSTEEIA